MISPSKAPIPSPLVNNVLLSPSKQIRISPSKPSIQPAAYSITSPRRLTIPSSSQSLLSPSKPQSQLLSPSKPQSQLLSPFKPQSQLLSPSKPQSQPLFSPFSEDEEDEAKLSIEPIEKLSNLEQNQRLAFYTNQVGFE